MIINKVITFVLILTTASGGFAPDGEIGVCGRATCCTALNHTLGALSHTLGALTYTHLVHCAKAGEHTWCAKLVHSWCRGCWWLRLSNTWHFVGGQTLACKYMQVDTPMPPYIAF